MYTKKGTRRQIKAKRKAPEPVHEVVEETDEELGAAYAEDWDRELYGDDYEHLRDSGWIDR